MKRTVCCRCCLLTFSASCLPNSWPIPFWQCDSNALLTRTQCANHPMESHYISAAHCQSAFPFSLVFLHFPYGLPISSGSGRAISYLYKWVVWLCACVFLFGSISTKSKKKMSAPAPDNSLRLVCSHRVFFFHIEWPNNYFWTNFLREIWDRCWEQLSKPINTKYIIFVGEPPHTVQYT